MKFEIEVNGMHLKFDNIKRVEATGTSYRIVGEEDIELCVVELPKRSEDELKAPYLFRKR